MMLAMFAGEHRDDWDDLLPAVMMAYHSSVHESTGFSPYRLMFGEECPLYMDVGLPRRMHDMPDPINNLYALWVREALEVAYDQVVVIWARQSGDKNGLFDKRAVKRVFVVGDWTLQYYPPPQLRSANWIHHSWDPIWFFLLRCGRLEFNCTRILRKRFHARKVWCPGSPPTIRLHRLHIRSWALVRCVALRSDPPPPQCLTAGVGSLSPGLPSHKLRCWKLQHSCPQSFYLALLSHMSLRIADTHVLHPFFHHRFGTFARDVSIIDSSPLLFSLVGELVSASVPPNTTEQDDIPISTPTYLLFSGGDPLEDLNEILSPRFPYLPAPLGFTPIVRPGDIPDAVESPSLFADSPALPGWFLSEQPAPIRRYLRLVVFIPGIRWHRTIRMVMWDC